MKTVVLVVLLAPGRTGGPCAWPTSTSWPCTPSTSSRLAAILVMSAEQAHHSELDSFPDSLWWAIATVTTVGYARDAGRTSPTC